MRRTLFIFAAFLAIAGPARSAGMLIPEEKKLPPLAMLDHRVDIRIEDQVATTYIEQTFRNHTDRQLEATYLLPIPKGATVNEFYMWVGPTKVKGELIEADKARKIYTDIVHRTKDPGLLEYVGTNLLRMKVFPVPAKGDQKVAVKYSYVCTNDSGLVDYIYPLRSEGKAASTLEKFTLDVRLKSQHAITNIYSPTHAITITRPNDKEAVIGFEKNQAILDKDFQLFYMPGNKDKDVGLTALTHRPNADQNGHFMLLVSPRAELSKSQQVPRDMVFVLDTSGSMRGKRIVQAKNALNYCLTNLSPNDNFAIMHFATAVVKYADNLQTASPENLAAAKRWVSALEPTGGTAINDALKTAMEMRTNDKSRTFTIVFFTDGQPTVGETNIQKILQNVADRNTQNTRIFSFGVGDDVNAHFLDALSDNTRAVSTYVRESEDIEAKVSSLYGKISNPVLSNLKLQMDNGVILSEIYPPQLPDLFHGSQLVVLGRYSGKGHAAIKLTGTVGTETKEFVYELQFPDKTNDERVFVEDLWARRKVGYLLDQIRVNGEKKELVDEVVSLAKRYGITTPYTSYLLVPDGALPPIASTAPGGGMGRGLINKPGAPPAAFQPGYGFGGGINGGIGGFGGGAGAGGLGRAGGLPGPGGAGGPAGPATSSNSSAKPPKTVTELTQQLAKAADKDAKDDKNGFHFFRLQLNEAQLQAGEKGAKRKEDAEAFKEQRETLRALDEARRQFATRNQDKVQSGKLGVDFAVQNNALRFQDRLSQTANRFVQKRNLIDVGGVWIDEKFDPKMQTTVVKAQSNAYFRILERYANMKEVFALGNYFVWVAPNGTALIVDQNDGQEELSDEAIDRLFTALPPAAPAKK
jgi:Ca-activated chloride channel family protein